MVPETGLEPAHQTAYAPKAYVYTNFTTRARYARPRFANGLSISFVPIRASRTGFLKVPFHYIIKYQKSEGFCRLAFY